MKKIIIAVAALAGIFAGSLISQAQVPMVSSYGSGAFPCFAFSQSFTYGARDSWTGGGVSQLQQYLGILPTGYFGPMTRSKLRIFQGAHSIPATGYFGPMTRGWIVQNICGNNPQPVPVPPPYSQVPVISYLSPASGPVGAQVTITGSGFSSSQDYILIDGGTFSGAISSYDGTHLTFAVPNSVGAACNLFSVTGACPMYARLITPGTHTVAVETINGTSNAMNFTVTGGSTCPPGSCYSQPPVINGGTFPTTLSVNQVGTWTVNATDPLNGPLTYSVNWGDSTAYNYPYANSAASAPIQQSSTFTHTYSNAGTYTVTFTVTSSSGLTAQTTATVLVGNGTQASSPVISQISPSSGPAGTIVTIRGTGFAPTGNTVYFSDGTAWGAGTYSNNISSPDGATLTFIVPSSKGMCPPNAYCSLVYWPPYQPGTYPVSVTNTNGTSNSVNFSLTGSAVANDSGITGTVTLGPTCPVQYYPPQPQCANQPYSTALAINTYGNSAYVSTTVTSDANGNFSIALPAGTYTISQQNTNQTYPRLSPQTVNVLPHQYANVSLMFDTGIR